MQTTGLVLDLYDDPRDLRSIFPSLDVVPETVKTAQVLTADMRDALPDDVFALVLMEGGDRLRKYACVDAGNTELNVAYFFKHGHKLPPEAQQLAAENLKIACAWYGIDVPEALEKVALGVNTVLTALTAPSQIKGAAGAVSRNLAATNAAGGQVITPQNQHVLGSMLKGAEASGTSLMPSQPPGDLTTEGDRGKPGTSNTSVMKSATVGHLVDGHRGDVPPELETTRGAAGEQYEKAPQTPLAALRPHIGVLNKEPPKLLKEKAASRYAVGNVFPLDSYDQVKAASAYFDVNSNVMDPSMRREFAVNLVPRASELGIEFSKLAAAYGSSTFATEEHIQIGYDMRLPHLMEKQAAVLESLYGHRAELGPDLFCETLAEFDKLAEIDHLYDRAILDPYASTYGVQKLASDDGDSWVSGNDYVTKRQIVNYSVTAGVTLADDYGPDFKKEFMKDPWGIFMSLPLEQKRRMARAATDNSATGLHDVQ
jgi:hypothetical protein